MERDGQKKKSEQSATDDESGIRRNIATQMETSHEGLLSNDRRMIKGYLGYIPVVHLHNGIKRMEDACAYVRSTLWPDGLTPQQKELEEKPYDLEEEYVKEKLGQEIPRIFPKETLEDAKKMFVEASREILSPESESGLLRAFQVKYSFFFLSLSLSIRLAHSLNLTRSLTRSLAHSLTRSLSSLTFAHMVSLLFFSSVFFFTPHNTQNMKRDFASNLSCRKNGGAVRCFVLGPVRLSLFFFVLFCFVLFFQIAHVGNSNCYEN